MQAKRIDGQAVNGKRTMLSEVIPLSVPYAITFFPIYACNFKCNYCIHSLDIDKRNIAVKEALMSIELFEKCIDDIAKFPEKIKAIHFAGLGEPLLHPNIVDMVKYASQKNVAETIDILTNGSLLTRELSTQLVSSGVNKIRISIQGTNAKKYNEVAGVSIDFDAFLQNIDWLYKNRKDTLLYIKIIDEGLTKSERDEFLYKFGDICDEIAIEYLCPFVENVDYENVVKDYEFNMTMNGNEVPIVEVCPQPFFSLQIYPDGSYVPCCTVEQPIRLGNCKTESIYDIWNGDKLKAFRKMQLKKQKKNNDVCMKCQQYKYSMFPEEVLDKEAEELVKKFE